MHAHTQTLTGNADITQTGIHRTNLLSLSLLLSLSYSLGGASQLV